MKPITTCRACDSKHLIEFLDLGEQYLSDFREDKSKPPKYPLVVVYCEDCSLVQLKHTTPQNEMYHDRYGFKSGISDSIKRDLDDIVTHAYQYNNDPKTWLDIASNDGYLLSRVPTDVYRVGVDPVKFLCEEAEQYADLIINDYFRLPSVFQPSNGYDVITSISCFYDMPQPERFVKEVKAVLGRKGVWIIQQNYLLTTMELSAVDNFCHEHLEYYTLYSLENLLEPLGLEVNEVQLSDVNGGSIRTVVSRRHTFPVDESVERLRTKEMDYGVKYIKTYRDFAERIGTQLTELHRLVTQLHTAGKKIVILAASTRGSTIWQSADIGKCISYAAERNPAKAGKWFSPIGIPIISEEDFRKDKPDYAIVGPWFFAPEIIAREQEYLNEGGCLIVPLPKVEIINKDNYEQRIKKSATARTL